MEMGRQTEKLKSSYSQKTKRVKTFQLLPKIHLSTLLDVMRQRVYSSYLHHAVFCTFDLKLCYNLHLNTISPTVLLNSLQTSSD